MIYVSTGGYSKKKPSEIYKYLKKNGIFQIEFSGGKFDLEIKKLFKKKNPSIQFHNYFPPNQRPFVFNLSSANKEILNKSLSMAKKNIINSKKIGAKYFSLHAGFRIDPNLEELGEKIYKKRILKKTIAEKNFYKSIKQLVSYAKKYGIILLIENNVISKKNLKSFGENPFLFTRPEEIKDFFLKFGKSNNLGLLLDVAHLKVSSKTLGFDMYKAHKEIAKFTKGYHLSDNNGIKDSNQPFSENSWFWKNINKKAFFFTIEVYNVNIKTFFKLTNLIKKKLGTT